MTETRSFLESELNQLSRLLVGISADAVLDRASIVGRIASVRAQLDALPLEIRRSNATLTFRGKPVQGSHGISAEFGSRAAKSFADAYSAVVASIKESLRYMGPIPARAEHELLIVGTAVGSFGFKFELPPTEPDLLNGDGTIELNAIEQIRDLLEVSARGSDEEISDIVDAIHPRAVKKVSDFLDLLKTSDAVCGLDVAERHFRFSDAEQLRFSAERLADGNIREGDDMFEGSFIGVLPKSRNFEFYDKENGIVIRGKVAPEIDDAAILNDYVKKLVKVKLRSVQVGQGRPRYTLASLNDIN